MQYAIHSRRRLRPPTQDRLVPPPVVPESSAPVVAAPSGQPQALVVREVIRAKSLTGPQR